MRAAHAGVGIPQDADRGQEHVLRGEAASLVARRKDATVTTKITPLLVPRPMVATIELVERSSAAEKKIRSGHDRAVLTQDLVLRFDGDPAHDMKDAKQPLEDRLGASVHQRYRTS
jgi:hypothetical protein